MLLAKAGVQYEDKRLEFSEFTALKESGKLPAGQLLLYDDVKRVCFEPVFRYTTQAWP